MASSESPADSNKSRSCTTKTNNGEVAGDESRSTVTNTSTPETRSNCSPSSAECFPVDSENPFEHPCLGSDLVLVVEGRQLHVHRTVLVLHSPVFHKMLTADMKEKNLEEIELPDRQHRAMVNFLLQMYPVHSFKNLKDDEDLMDILPLADFFQADHVRIKCEKYIQLETQRPPDQLTVHSKMLYLAMCETYRLETPFAAALDMAATLPVDAITNSSNYDQLQPATKVSLLERRCRVAERSEAWERDKVSDCRRVVSSFCIKSRTSRLDERCPSCRWVNWYCERCVQKEIGELKTQMK
ncbi:BTB and MATH domain-containing protein 36-like [Littorina saxatilis]|uniref:BTB domain-containing protein n=1 Tax=Littorina saxatilis TaxID=31220 RepID=A0AAN9GFP6_9CAEN